LPVYGTVEGKNKEKIQDHISRWLFLSSALFICRQCLGFAREEATRIFPLPSKIAKKICPIPFT
jgi:hypothetical protein